MFQTFNLILWMDGWLLGAEMESRRNIVWYEAGAAKVLNPEYLEQIQNLPLREVVEDPAGVERALAGLGVEAARRAVFSGELFLGGWLARDPGAAVGGWVTVRARSRFGAFQTLDLCTR